MDFVWNLQKVNKQRKAMQNVALIQVNFEVHCDFACRGRGLVRKDFGRALASALGLIDIRQAEYNGSTHTRWIGVTTPYLLFRHLQAWRTFMLTMQEHAVAFAWQGENGLEGTLYAQEAYAAEWDVFNPEFFEVFQ